MPDKDEKQLQNLDVTNELKVLSPIEKESLKLQNQADNHIISDKATYSDAKKIKRALVAHRTSTVDLRRTFTRKLDNIKQQFIQKQDEVLRPAIIGEQTIGEKIEIYEKEERARKEEEERRIQAIVDLFNMPADFDRRTATLDDVKRVRAYIKAELSMLIPKDRNKKVVKDKVADLRSRLDDEEQFINDRIEQEKEKARQDEERKRLEEERAAAAAKEPEPTPQPKVEPPVATTPKATDPITPEPATESKTAGKKFVLYFTTTIRGSVIVEAKTDEEANEIGKGMALETVSYDDMQQSTGEIPDVSTEFDDIQEAGA